MSTKISMEQLQQKINEMKTSGAYDLSTEEDLSIAIMNLISLEEHFFFTGNKTGKDEYFGMVDEVRQIRKDLLARMMPQNEGETWCISKHLLSTTMRMMEVGTKLQGDGKTEEAKDYFQKAYKIYSLFWAVRFRLINTEDVQKVAGNKDEKNAWSYEDLVTKLVDCCKE
ncbi:MAG: hypothetical protein KatS3mg087_1292 [Patescibacteria group bacterium]|nr:MAG: hypothetical protein KatS3mg087_1292 [Patescibacteria group bacterium]